ncbi:hypothetical protein CTAYLR_001757 [Chrysophaeum taylorii]|uniref:Dihydrolipoamide acetyltransferase component of pyruvate dehydrogenase complex n=1 Tax=Chrysophaeum taylorii TaxID=2483200 RepID=A0AAD7UGZ1_9STRA|nr:hypothetical protein CTAYLR_001757 [Chrysophaeum taylorii]
MVRWLSYPSHQVVGLPSLSPTMEAGTISTWKVEVGGSYGAGDVIAEIETDKATVDFEAQDDGIVAKLLVDKGSEVKVGTPIMVVVEDAADVAAFENFAVEAVAPAAAAAPAPAAPAPKSGDPFLLTPAARFLSHSKKIDATGLAGSGKGGRITKGDVLNALKKGVKFPALAQQQIQQEVTAAPAPAPPPATATLPAAAAATTGFDVASIPTTGAPFVDTPASSMRKVISKRLTESRATVPHSFASVTVELDDVAKFRKELAAMDVKVSVNDVVIRACALALRDVPKANSAWIDGNAHPNASVDISVAVATPNGLITPIVFDAPAKGLAQISAEVRDLAGRARIGKLKPEEYQGGTCSVSNLGMFGIKEFSAVINPPQACILAVGAGVPTLKLDDSGNPRKATTMTSRLSYDRRVVDEPLAALFLQAYAHYMANPKLLML